MKNKLETVKAALEFYAREEALEQERFTDNANVIVYTTARNALTTLNELIETLEGEGLVEEAQSAIKKKADEYEPTISFYAAKIYARAAINVIKGKI